MYIHLGNNCLIKKEDIVGIFDLDNTTVSSRTRQFLSKAEKSEKVVLAGSELPKSFIVAGKEKEKTKVYLTFLSPSTLEKRFENNNSNYFKEI